jgi:indolepyruvate ferredoxin oxidoreductase
MALWKAKKHLASHDVVFMPGLNEDLAATAVWGTQQVNLYENAQVDGVFGMWYGKGPGVDRSADVLKHANAAGTSKHGGVLMLAGDDHAAKSSSVAHQSEHLLIACGIPVLYPSNVQEYLDYGIHAWAMSRYSGLWVSMKCVTDVVESTASVDMDPERVQVVLPEDFEVPKGAEYPLARSPLDQEARMLDHKWYAALAYIRANRLNRVVIDSPKARFGIMAAGKAYLDVRQALTDLGLDDETCQQIGIRVFKVGCVWPLDAHDARDFAPGWKKSWSSRRSARSSNMPSRKSSTTGVTTYARAFTANSTSATTLAVNGRAPWPVVVAGTLRTVVALIAKAIASRLGRSACRKMCAPKSCIALPSSRPRSAKQPARASPSSASRGSVPAARTTPRPGCRKAPRTGRHRLPLHGHVDGQAYRNLHPDGRGGRLWLGQMHFSGDKHVFVNLGDGTYFHSGLLAIRAAVAGKANITYKILFNDAVAMTGGQPVDGILTVPQIARQLAAEGTSKVLIVTDEPEKFASREGLPAEVAVHHRDEFDRLQKELRDTAGVTILIYDQTCATEKRRRRKRGDYPDPARRVFINEEVCEGCGDCSTASNCLSVEPLETSLGTKRKVNQSSCNKDFSCLKGFCPSFVTAEGARLKKLPVAAILTQSWPALRCPSRFCPCSSVRLGSSLQASVAPASSP